MASMTSARPHTPASGKPPATDLAKVVRSAVTPICSMAKKLPVRPAPVCTSSAISRIPCRSQSARRRCMNCGEATRKPPSPCTGSTTRAARSEEHTSELQSRPHLVCRLLLEKKKKNNNKQKTDNKKNTTNKNAKTVCDSCTTTTETQHTSRHIYTNNT